MQRILSIIEPKSTHPRREREVHSFTRSPGVTYLVSAKIQFQGSSCFPMVYLVAMSGKQVLNIKGHLIVPEIPVLKILSHRVLVQSGL